MNKQLITVNTLIFITSQMVFGQTNVFPANGNVGVGTVNPLVGFHVMKEDTGIKSQYSLVMMEATDAQLDIVSSSAGTWGSSINFIEGNNTSNTNIWSIARQTTGGDGDSSLRINFGVNNQHDNANMVTVKSDGKVGIGTTNPTAFFEVNKSVNNSWTAKVYNGAGERQGLFVQSGYGGSQSSNNPTILRLEDNNGNVRMKVQSNGKVGIGTDSPNSTLSVKGKIHAEEVKVDLSVPGPDYVFKEGYNLKSLEEVRNYIKEHGHLPDIPSSKEMEANGIQLGEMNMKLLEKIEELTLYTLEQEKKIKAMLLRIENLEPKN